MQHSSETPEVLAVITNSGSTNIPGYTFTLHRDGSGSIAYTNRYAQWHFDTYKDRRFATGALAIRALEATLIHIGDVSTIPNRGCMKSVSFGFTLTITYRGKTSGDLTCLNGSDAQTFLNLKEHVQQISLHIN